MRVLVVPEVYHPGDLSSNGTVSDAVSWVEQWLGLDERLHVYWLLPPREAAGYEPSDVLADRDRVTLVEAEPLASGGEQWSIFSEGGYSKAQLTAIAEAIFDAGAYVDVVVDQLRTGRFTLYKWLLHHSDQWAAQVRPFDVIADVHDLQVPFKYRWCSYRNAFQMHAELCAVTFADGAWFHAGVDERAYERYARAVLRPEIVDRRLDRSVRAGSPLDLGDATESYREEPRYLHVAGSLWDKKGTPTVLDAAEALAERFGVRTVMTSMEEIPAAYRDLPFVEAHSEADEETYRRALRRGDLAICASEYETVARTPFEQAASGQVLLLRDEPWIYDCVPDDYELVGGVDELADLALAAVDDWAAAVAENRRLVEHVRRVRSPERCGRRTYEDLRSRVERKLERYEPDGIAATVEESATALLGDSSATAPVPLDELLARTADRSDDGRPVTDREDCALADVVYALRACGYRDVGNPGTPAFEPIERPPTEG